MSKPWAPSGGRRRNCTLRQLGLIQLRINEATFPRLGLYSDLGQLGGVENLRVTGTFRNSQYENFLDSKGRCPGPGAGHRIRMSCGAVSLSPRLAHRASARVRVAEGMGIGGRLASNLMLVPRSPCSRVTYWLGPGQAKTNLVT